MILRIAILFIIASFFGCSTKNDSSVKIPEVTKENLGNTRLILERGAFHYDRFEIRGNEIIYYPYSNIPKHPINTVFDSIYIESIDSVKMINFLNEIGRKGFWKFNEEYQSSTTCNSGLRILFKVGDRAKEIHCEDFERNCPELLYETEKGIIRLLGKKLKRVYLPG